MFAKPANDVEGRKLITTFLLLGYSDNISIHHLLLKTKKTETNVCTVKEVVKTISPTYLSTSFQKSYETLPTILITHIFITWYIINWVNHNGNLFIKLGGYQMYMFKFTNAYDYFIITFQLFSISQSDILQCFE